MLDLLFVATESVELLISRPHYENHKLAHLSVKCRKEIDEKSISSNQTSIGDLIMHTLTANILFRTNSTQNQLRLPPQIHTYHGTTHTKQKVPES